MPLDRIAEHVRRAAIAVRCDRELLAAFATFRDEAAFAELVRRHGAMVRGVCRRACGDPLADDAAQATFLLLAERAGSRRWTRCVAPWLHAVARNIARKARVAEARRKRRETRPPCPPVASPLDDLLWKDAVAVIDDEPARLPKRLRGPLVLCHWEGLTRDEAAERLGVGLGTFKRDLERGRERLRVRLTRRGLAPGFLALLTADSAFAWSPTPSAVAIRLAQGYSHMWTIKLTTAALILGGLAASIGFVGSPTVAPAIAAPVPARVPKPGEDWNGDPLPKHAVARLGSGRWRTGAFFVYDAAVAPDGRATLVSGNDGLSVWDSAGRFIGEMRSPDAKRGVFAATALADDGRKAVTVEIAGRNANFVAWDIASRQGALRSSIPLEFVRYEFTINGRTSRTNRAVIRLAPGGAVAAILDGDAVAHVWDASTGRETRVLAPDGGRVEALAFGDAATLATIHADGTARVTDVATGRETAKFAVDGVRNLVALSPDGRWLVCAKPVDFAIGGPFASGGAIELWDVRSARKLWTADAFTETTNGVAFAASGDVIATGKSRSGAVGRWDAATGRRVWFDESVAGRPDVVRVGGSTATVAAMGHLRRWDVATGRELPSADGMTNAIQRLEFAADGATVATIYSGHPVGFRRTWDAATGQPLGREPLGLPGDLGSYYGPGAARAVTLDIVDRRSIDRLRDLKTGRMLCEWRLGAMVEPPFSRDGSRIAIFDVEGRLGVWDAENGKPIWSEKLSADGKTLWWAAFSVDGSRLAFTDGELLRVFDAATGKKIMVGTVPDSRPIPGRPMPVARDRKAFVGDIAFSPDGDSLAVGLPGRLVIVNPMSGEPHGEIAAWTHRPEKLVWSPDGRSLAVCSSEVEGIHIYDVASGNELRKLVGHRGYVTALAFSPDGKRLASAAYDLTALVWDVSDLRR